MRITAEIYKKLLNGTIEDYEVGGILGGRNNIINTICFDKNKPINYVNAYIPNVDFLNSEISKWYNENKEFYGIFHSHTKEQCTLSSGDIKTIKAIMCAIKCHTKLLFPIVIPNDKVYFYSCRMKNDKIIIHSEKINIICERR